MFSFCFAVLIRACRFKICQTAIAGLKFRPLRKVPKASRNAESLFDNAAREGFEPYSP